MFVLRVMSCLFRPLRSNIHMFPEWVPLLQRPLHPRPLVLWWRGGLRRRLWWAPLLQWVWRNSSHPQNEPVGFVCHLPPPHYQLLGYCVFVSVRQSSSACWCERVLWVMWRRLRVAGVFLCWWCGQSGLLLCAAFLCGDAPQCPLTNTTSPSLCPPGVTEPHFGFCLDSSPCMGMWRCHDYFESQWCIVPSLIVEKQWGKYPG